MTEMNEKEFIEEAMALIKQELTNRNYIASQVLFGDELGASDWTPEAAVDALFRYASNYGWGDDGRQD